MLFSGTALLECGRAVEAMVHEVHVQALDMSLDDPSPVGVEAASATSVSAIGKVFHK